MPAETAPPDDGVRVRAHRATAVRGFFAQLGDPLSYSTANRCLFASMVMTTGVLLFFLVVVYVEGWPYLPPDVDPGLMSLVARIAGGWALPWVATILAALWARRRAPEARPLAYVTTQLYAVTFGAFTYLTGPFYSPGWIAFIGGAVLGLLLFGRRPTIAACVSFVALLGAAMWARHRGLLPYAVPLTDPAAADRWALRMAICSVFFAAFTLSLSGYIIARWRDRERSFEIASHTDALTGVANRRRLMEACEREIARAARYRTPLSCVLVDLDHFKRINDTHGHLAGDRVLVAAADALRGELRDSDLIARYGGEEFVLLLPNTPMEGAERLAARCRERLEETRILFGDTALRVTASFGVATCAAGDVGRPERLLDLADGALYRAKRDGRNRVALAA